MLRVLTSSCHFIYAFFDLAPLLVLYSPWRIFRLYFSNKYTFVLVRRFLACFDAPVSSKYFCVMVPLLPLDVASLHLGAVT